MHVGVVRSAVTAAALAAVVACARTPPACPAAPSGPSAPRLDRCIEPPWVPTNAGTPRAPGWTVENCGDPRTWGFVHRGTQTLSEDDLLATGLRDVVLQTKAMYGVDAGDYWCGKQRGEQRSALPALKFRLRLCAVSVDDVFNRLATFVNEHGLGDRAFGIDVFVGGDTGPRCPRDDARCGPESNDSATSGGRCIETVPITSGPLTSRSRGQCGHDGDCQIDCESFCVSWTEQRPICLKGPREPGEEEAWCGCIAGRCGWSRRPAGAR